MTEMFNELAIIGDAIDENDRVVYLLASLPESFDVLVTALEANDDVPKMEMVVERLLHEERKLRDRGNPGAKINSKEAMIVKQRRKGPRFHYCKKYDHIQHNCREHEKAQGQGYHSEAHQSDSRKLKGMKHNVNTIKAGSHPDDSSDSDETGLLVDHVLSSKVNISPGLSTSGKWIIDSGATCHICNNRSSFVELYPQDSH